VRSRSAAFEIRSKFSRWSVTLNPSAGRVDGDQRAQNQELSSELGFMIEGRDAAAIEQAERALHALEGSGTFASAFPSGSPASDLFLRLLAASLREALSSGLLLAEREERLPATPAETAPRPPVPSSPPPKEKNDTLFDVRYVDETGQAIGNVGVRIDAGGEPREIKTNAAGVALLEGVTAFSATATVSPEALDKVVDPRWEKKRPGKAPKVGNMVSFLFRGAELPPVPLKAAVPHVVVVTPPLGTLFVELWDKTGRARHAECKYKITGPEALDGETDEQGRLRHDDVIAGDYSLELELPEDGGTVQTPLVVLPTGASEPQVRFLGAVEMATLVRLIGAFFDTNKSFLLPEGVDSLRDIEALYMPNNPSELLIVGHADTTGKPSTNDPLSLERAEKVAAYLRDDVDDWLSMWGTPVPESRRWGRKEDLAMLGAMPDFDPALTKGAAIRRFQESRCLDVDGDIGPNTRRQLVTEYMALDSASLGDEGFTIPVTSHGCGENFPLNKDGELDEKPADGVEDGLDRRVELFFFDPEKGIRPPPPGKNSKAGASEYPEWRKLAARSRKDVVLLPRRRITLIDEAGMRLSLEPYELVTESGETIQGAADDMGVITLPPGIGREATLRLTTMSEEVTLAVV
jgi:outer membrane protein OmpA-like peptidoglycan-associated protein